MNLKFKFNTIDLFVVTAIVAAIAGSFRVEEFYFRQLIWLALVSTGATIMVACFRHSKRRHIPAAIGGFLGAFAFLVICLLFRDHLFADDGWRFVSPYSTGPLQNNAALSIKIEMVAFTLASFPVGAAMGPLIALRFRNETIGEPFLKRFWLSIILGAAAMLLALFSVYERKLMSDRDWDFLLVIVVAFFIIHSINWFRRLELSEQRDLDDAMINQVGIEPVCDQQQLN